MKLSSKQEQQVLQRFPNFELSYEKNIYKKVFKDIKVAIPKGRKYLAWFTYYKGEPTCFLLQKHHNSHKIISIEINLACFNEVLCLNTIVYGTLIKQKSQNFFAVEDIYYYKNTFVGRCIQYEKIQHLESFFSNISMDGYFPNILVFGMCLMNTNYKDLVNDVRDLNYPMYCIQHRSMYKLEPYLNSVWKDKQEDVLATFKVKAETQNDIYSLYCYENGEKYYDSAYISNYETSKMLNSLFRNIKENVDLDALEESDSEEEFENTNEDKFMLHKTFYMECRYVSKFKKWEPIRLAKERKMISFSKLKNI